MYITVNIMYWSVLLMLVLISAAFVMFIFVYFYNYGILEPLSALEFQVFVCLAPTHSLEDVRIRVGWLYVCVSCLLSLFLYSWRLVVLFSLSERSLISSILNSSQELDGRHCLLAVRAGLRRIIFLHTLPLRL